VVESVRNVWLNMLNLASRRGTCPIYPGRKFGSFLGDPSRFKHTIDQVKAERAATSSSMVLGVNGLVGVILDSPWSLLLSWCASLKAPSF
jgi:hypothetical protein